MADPVEISIVLDELPEGVRWTPEAGGDVCLRGGDEIGGTVEVRVHRDVEFSAFRLGFAWHTEGKGNRASGTAGVQELSGAGAWRAGDRMTFPFRLTAPWGPLSYRGKILRVLWDLEARVDRSLLQSDITRSLPLVLEGDPEDRGFDLGPKPQSAQELEAVKRGLGRVWVSLGLLLTMGGILFGAIRGWDLAGLERWAIFLAIATGFLLMLKGVWRRLGRGKLGEPVIQLSTTEVRRGEGILFSLTMRPDQRTEIRSLEAILECEERVVQGHGQYRSLHRKVVLEQRLSLAKDLIIEPHRNLRKKGTLTLPEDAPTSFGAPNNQLVWWLRFQADIVGWPDWKEPFVLTVRP